MDFLATNAVLSFFTLTFLEVILGIDNVVFISLATSQAPKSKQKQIRILGISLSWVGRILLLLGINWISSLDKTLFTIADSEFNYQDLIYIVGGLFLIGKSTSEIHSKIESKSTRKQKATAKSTGGVILQIFLLDAVFSLDSIITAIGLVEEVVIIIAAISVSMVVMLIFLKSITQFLEKHQAMKLLAISFLLMIGTVLVVEGFHVHVPKGYIYFAMAFALGVELLNMKIRKVRSSTS